MIGNNPGSTRVFVERGGKSVEVPVEVSRRLESQAFIASGLLPGDRVVMTNLDVLADGSLIAVQATVSAAESLAGSRTLTIRE